MKGTGLAMESYDLRGITGIETPVVATGTDGEVVAVASSESVSIGTELPAAESDRIDEESRDQTSAAEQDLATIGPFDEQVQDLAVDEKVFVATGDDLEARRPDGYKDRDNSVSGLVGVESVIETERLAAVSYDGTVHWFEPDRLRSLGETQLPVTELSDPLITGGNDLLAVAHGRALTIAHVDGESISVTETEFAVDVRDLAVLDGTVVVVTERRTLGISPGGSRQWRTDQLRVVTPSGADHLYGETEETFVRLDSNGQLTRIDDALPSTALCLSSDGNRLFVVTTDEDSGVLGEFRRDRDEERDRSDPPVEDAQTASSSQSAADLTPEPEDEPTDASDAIQATIDTSTVPADEEGGLSVSLHNQGDTDHTADVSLSVEGASIGGDPNRKPAERVTVPAGGESMTKFHGVRARSDTDRCTVVVVDRETGRQLVSTELPVAGREQSVSLSRHREVVTDDAVHWTVTASGTGAAGTEIVLRDPDSDWSSDGERVEPDGNVMIERVLPHEDHPATVEAVDAGTPRSTESTSSRTAAAETELPPPESVVTANGSIEAGDTDGDAVLELELTAEVDLNGTLSVTSDVLPDWTAGVTTDREVELEEGDRLLAWLPLMETPIGSVDVHLTVCGVDSEFSVTGRPSVTVDHSVSSSDRSLPSGNLDTHRLSVQNHTDTPVPASEVPLDDVPELSGAELSGPFPPGTTTLVRPIARFGDSGAERENGEASSTGDRASELDARPGGSAQDDSLPLAVRPWVVVRGGGATVEVQLHNTGTTSLTVEALTVGETDLLGGKVARVEPGAIRRLDDDVLAQRFEGREAVDVEVTARHESEQVACRTLAPVVRPPTQKELFDIDVDRLGDEWLQVLVENRMEKPVEELTVRAERDPIRKDLGEAESIPPGEREPFEFSAPSGFDRHGIAFSLELRATVDGIPVTESIYVNDWLGGNWETNHEGWSVDIADTYPDVVKGAWHREGE